MDGPLADTTSALGTAISGATNVTFTPNLAQLPTADGLKRYYAVIGQNGVATCSDTAFVAITVSPKPTPTAGSNFPICEGRALNLTSSGGITYAWTGPNSFTSTSQNPTISAATTIASGTYTVTVTSLGGCTAIATTAIVVNASPISTAGNNAPICAGNALNLTSSSGTTYAWAGPNSFTSTSQNPTISAAASTASGIYTVTVTNSGGCNVRLLLLLLLLLVHYLYPRLEVIHQFVLVKL